jgi:hypothetical protein
MTKKLNNMRLRKDTPQQLQDIYLTKWKALKEEDSYEKQKSLLLSR